MAPGQFKGALIAPSAGRRHGAATHYRLHSNCASRAVKFLVSHDQKISGYADQNDFAI